MENISLKNNTLTLKLNYKMLLLKLRNTKSNSFRKKLKKKNNPFGLPAICSYESRHLALALLWLSNYFFTHFHIYLLPLGSYFS